MPNQQLCAYLMRLLYAKGASERILFASKLISNQQLFASKNGYLTR